MVVPSKDVVVEVAVSLPGFSTFGREFCSDKMQAEKTPDVIEVTSGTLHTSSPKPALIVLTEAYFAIQQPQRAL